MEKERKVIIEELAIVADSPAQLADLLLDETSGPTSPSGGTSPAARSPCAPSRRQTTLEYLRRQYVPNNMVVAIAGAVDARAGPVADRRRWATGRGRPLRPGSPPSTASGRALRRPLQEDRAGPRLRWVYAASRCSTPTATPSALLFSVILGEGMSSRLFLELREKRGLCYDVNSYVSHFLDTGSFAVYAGVDPSKTAEAVQALLEELARLRDGVSREELLKAKELSKGRLLLRLEDTRAVSSWLGGQELLLRPGLRRRRGRLPSSTPSRGDDLRRVAADPAGHRPSSTWPSSAPSAATSGSRPY